MPASPSPYVVATATSRSKAAEWAANDCAAVLADQGDARMSEVAAQCRSAAEAAGLLAQRLEHPAEDDGRDALRLLIESALRHTVDCRAACLSLAEIVPQCADCARACQSCAAALRHLLAGYPVAGAMSATISTGQ